MLGGTKITWTHRLLDCAHDVDLLGGNIII